MFGISTALASWDQFGTWAKFNYRGESGYGTGYGGLCSLCVTIVSTLFIFLQLFGFFFFPAYNQSATIIYLGVSSGIEQDYTMYEGDFLPTFWVNTTHTMAGDETISFKWTP